LESSDPFVLKDPHDHSTILRLPVRSLVVSDLPALAHRARSQQVGQGNVALLHQKLSHAIGAVFAKLLVQSDTAACRGIANNLNVVGLDSLGFLCQFLEAVVVLRADHDFTVPKIDGYFVKNVIIVQLAEPRNRSVDGRFIGGDLLLLGGQLLLLVLQGLGLGFQFGVLLLQLVCVPPGLLLGFMETRLDGLGPFQIVALELD